MLREVKQSAQGHSWWVTEQRWTLQTLEPRPHLVFPELVDNGFMEEELDVFEKVKSSGRCGTLVNLLLMFGFMGINALQDAQPPGR